MPVIAYPAATSVVNLAAFLWQNRAEIGPSFRAIGGVVESALTGSRPEIQRIGNVLVSIQADQTQVIGLLHQQNARLEGISSRLAGVADRQAALSQSLSALQQLSTISLGLNAVAHLVLLHQFRLLGRQLATLSVTVHRIHNLIEAQQLGILETGLTQLQNGIEDIQTGAVDQGRTTINTNAANNLAQSVNTHAILLGRELRATRVDPLVGRELFHHLAVGLMGEVGCHLALGNATRARDAIQGRVSLLEEYARSVFARTVGDDAVRFLCPGLASHGVSVEFLAELLRQASHAGAIEGRSMVVAIDLIEEWRDRLHTVRDPWRSSTMNMMRADLTEVVTAIEEVNRVKGFGAAIRHFESERVPFNQVMERVHNEITSARRSDATLTDDICYAYLPAPD